ncbi:hypothetical protein G5B31_10960 [Rhodobacter sp. SGA-6-6]|uniref:hypothetical protein n=1 Tax=Rhodobacter sp. SGA-6-6 TaxID=2710882 RepID=UPI0013ECAE4B|nr:hypothetical protein [Rhodobacter sp. SGA-6-6]NGM46059.1 hypothetical protein [Rhodobacter sp. SGA-6-6]
MSGNKTHDQQRRILEKRVDTSNADKDFDPRPDLKREEAGLPPPAPPGGPAGKGAGTPTHQESAHNKHRGAPEEKET